MRAGEVNRQTGLNGSNHGAEFLLTGGLYQVTAMASAWNSGSVQLFQLGADQSTWLTVVDSITEDGGDTFFLPPGRFRWSITDATGVTALVVRVPGE